MSDRLPEGGRRAKLIKLLDRYVPKWQREPLADQILPLFAAPSDAGPEAVRNAERDAATAAWSAAMAGNARFPDWLAANFPGENVFWASAQKWSSPETALTGKQIKEIANIAPNYQLFQDNFGERADKGIGDGEAVSIVGSAKHFYATPPATFYPVGP